MKEQTKMVHVNTWEEFKKLAIAFHPEFIAYTIQNAPLSRPPLGLRLVFTSESMQYIFLDFAEGSFFRRTKLPVHSNENGEAYFEEEELKNFIQAELKRKNISLVSFEILGY